MLDWIFGCFFPLIGATTLSELLFMKTIYCSTFFVERSRAGPWRSLPKEFDGLGIGMALVGMGRESRKVTLPKELDGLGWLWFAWAEPESAWAEPSRGEVDRQLFQS